MQTSIEESFLKTHDGQVAEAILRKCVHCGFCTATCPTYQLLGDELDGPRGRIYLIKEMLEGADVGISTLNHLDRCLTCRACETTCPSGVEYGRLVDVGRQEAERRVSRPRMDRLKRELLVRVVPHPRRFAALLRGARMVQGLLPETLRAKIPAVPVAAGVWPAPRHGRRMLVLDGCAQSVIGPATNAATARIFDRHGISLIRVTGVSCCGAVALHTSAQDVARDTARQNIDAWWPHLEAGVEAIVMTASGCGVTVREYPELLAEDSDYAAKATELVERVKDVSEVVAEFVFDVEFGEGRRVAYHPPCTLQHGQQITGVVEGILKQLGYEVFLPKDAHLCCGSAGTYSLLQSEIATSLRANKLKELSALEPELIVSANIGCISHLASESEVPVMHWIELLDRDAP